MNVARGLLALSVSLVLVGVTAGRACASSTAEAAELAPSPAGSLSAEERAKLPVPSAPGATVSDDGIVSDGVDIVEHLGEKAAIDVPLVDHEGKIVKLRDYMGKRPVILALVYYRCPVLCSVLLSGLAKALQGLDWMAGKEFDVLTVSIDPNETTALAKEKRRGYLQALGRQGTDGAWPFFTGGVEATDMLARSVGFKFKYVERERQFAHVAALFFLSPDGTITRYLYGIEFDPKEMKLALFEAGQGRVGTPLERVYLRCFKFDPASRKYHSFVKTYYRIWGAIILGALAALLGTLWRRELKKTAMRGSNSSTGSDSSKAKA